MKKTKLLSLLAITPLAVNAAILSSCHKSNSHFIDIPEADKQVEAFEGLDFGIYEIKLNNALDKNYHLEATATTISSSAEGLSIEIPYIIPFDERKTIDFVAQMSGLPSNTEYWINFDLDITCKDSSNNTIWTETIKGFKLTVTQEETESHTVSADSVVKCVAVGLDKTSIGAEDEATLTLTNDSAELTGVTLTYNVGEKTFSETINVPNGESTIALSKEIINEKLTAKGLEEMGSSDTISLVLVIVGSYEVDEDSHIYKYDKQGELQQLTTEEFSALENKYLLKDEYGMFNIGTVTLQELLQNAAGNSTNNIYLVKGTYTPGRAKRTSAPNTNANIYGVLSYTGEKLAKFNVCNEDPSQEGQLDCEAVSFYLYDLDILGEDDATVDWKRNGIRANRIDATRCNIKGAYTQNGLGKFEDCTFDSSSVVSSGSTQYTFFWYYASGTTGTTKENPSLQFDNCTFTNCGKGFKAFAEISSTVDDHVVFNNCEFKYVDKGVSSLHSPMNINGSCKGTDAYYNIWYTNTSMTNYPSSITSMYEIENGHCKINGSVPSF